MEGGDVAAGGAANAAIEPCPGANRSRANTDRPELGDNDVAEAKAIERPGDGGAEASEREVTAAWGAGAVAPPELDRRRVAHGGMAGRCGDAQRTDVAGT
jgi:hypothetical protein